PDPAARLGAEQLLFAELVAAPRRGLVLSYAAVDEQGQPLLPSSFLRELLASGIEITITRQRMLLDGYFTQEPMSEAELRVQYARAATGGFPYERGNLPQVPPATPSRPPLASEVIGNLARAQAVAEARFRSDTFGAFDGVLRHPAVTTELARRFG